MKTFGARAAIVPFAITMNLIAPAAVGPALADPAAVGATTPAAAAAPADTGNTTPATPPAAATPTPAPVEAAPADTAAKPSSASDAPATTAATEPAASDANKPEAPPLVQAPPTPDATTPQPAAQPAAAAATTPAVNPVVEAVRTRLTDAAASAGKAGDYFDVLKAFYAARSEPLWIKDGVLSVPANAAIGEIKKADSYGLDASQFDVPDLASGAAADAQADAEIKLSAAVLKYAHHARGGRIDPLALSNILDMKPPLKDAAVVMTEIAASSEPDAYLRGLHPKHPQFAKLKDALAAARGPQVEAPVDEALKVKLPEGKTLKVGQEHDDIALLRKRLKVEIMAGATDRTFDPILETAVKAFQEENGLKVNGQLNARTRAALNREGEPKTADPKRDVDRIIANMERWRWLPEDLGDFYIFNNIPEYQSRIIKNGEEALKVKMIVGQPSWPTPIMSSSLLYVIFQPEWGMPDGIKMKELLPRLKRASGGDNFFDQLFGGGSSSGGARVLAAYKLKPSLNGRPIDANSVDWNKVDIRRFSFVQPAGAENPLGAVKFRFPNRHDVYMHDTPQKALFNQSFRALSHGCLRVENHRRVAEVLLEHDKGWDSDKVGGMYSGGTRDITLDKPVPVYLTYFTVRVDDDGKLQKYGDIYGHDDRVSSALAGKPVRYQAPEMVDTVASNDATLDEAPQEQPAKKNKKAEKKRQKNTETAGDILSDALSGLLAN